MRIFKLSAAIFMLCSFNCLSEYASACRAQIITNQNRNTMGSKNFTTNIVVDKSPEEVFNAVNNVRGWWSESILGSTNGLNDEFFYNYKDVHSCKLRIVEFIPGKKVVWLVLENQFNFTEDKTEWKGNKIVFEISAQDGKTRLDFTQEGLVPEYECYKVCHDAWSSYIQGSLKDLITTGKGKPNTKENDLNKDLIEKWGLPEMKKENFSFSFKSSKPADQVYALLLDPTKWWSGLFKETFKGKSQSVNDEFSFKAGDGVHYSKQKLIEVIPGKRIVWLVTDSDLNFLKKTDEWTGTRIRFDLAGEGNSTVVTFTHEGLVPQIECYKDCSSAWTGYLENLKKRLE